MNVRPRLQELRKLASLSLLALVWGGCSGANHPEIELEIEQTRFSFVPRAAFAEYVELPAGGDQLRVTLTSYSTSCDEYQAPQEGEVRVTVTLRAPPGEPLAPGDFPWKGLEENPRAVTRVEALPFVRLASEGRLLSPGGNFHLTRLEKVPFGLVEGSFEFRPDGENVPELPSGGLRGAVRLRLCRASLDPSRAPSLAP